MGPVLQKNSKVSILGKKKKKRNADDQFKVNSSYLDHNVKIYSRQTMQVGAIKGAICCSMLDVHVTLDIFGKACALGPHLKAYNLVPRHTFHI